MSQRYNKCPEGHILRTLGYRLPPKGTRVLVKGVWFCPDCNKVFRYETQPHLVEIKI